MANRREFLKIGAALAAAGPLAALAAPADAQFYRLLDTLKDDGPLPQSPAAVAEARARLEHGRVQLRAFDPRTLSAEALFDYDSIVEGLALEAVLAMQFPFGAVGGTISPYVVSPRSGTWLLAQDTPEALAAIGFENERIRDDAALGVVPPDFILDSTIAKLAALRASASAPLRQAVDSQIATLTELRPRATHDAGVWRLPRGDEYYDLALRWAGMPSIDPPRAHNEGLARVRDLSAKADVLLKKQGLAYGTVGVRLHRLGRDVRYHYSDDDAGRAKAVAEMNARLDRIRPSLAPLFTGLSPGAITVELAGPGKIGYRVAPSYDGSKSGAYYVDLREIGRRPSWSLPTVVHHETLPGHLLQLPLQEHANPTPLRLRYAPNAFFEGWAIYAEQLADEMGLYADDELARLGMLQSLLVRAARLVIDTGIHFKRWSREEAIARFFDIAGDAPDTLENEVDRIVVQPGTTSGPAIGRWAILDLRDEARRQGWDLKRFHDALLKRGALRLTVLERALRAQM